MSEKITALKIQKRNPNRVNVYLDGEFAFGLSKISAAWLQVGQELNSEKIKELRELDEHEVAYQRSLNLIKYRPRSSEEIIRNLEKHKTNTEVIDGVLERLHRSGLVNDELFARNWVENRIEFRPRGRRALIAELRKFGIEQEIIEQVLDGLDEEPLAYRVAEKYTRKLEKLEWFDFRRKLTGYLTRRGFGFDVITPVVEGSWNELQEIKELNGNREEDL
jgi:regulatory protein